jgi:hypothetical protein
MLFCFVVLALTTVVDSGCADPALPGCHYSAESPGFCAHWEGLDCTEPDPLQPDEPSDQLPDDDVTPCNENEQESEEEEESEEEGSSESKWLSCLIVWTDSNHRGWNQRFEHIRPIGRDGIDLLPIMRC